MSRRELNESLDANVVTKLAVEVRCLRCVVNYVIMPGKLENIACGKEV